ncbi:AraC family transcriptional regulator ligand-binding domain-containing protein [Nocardia vinacea]|uniref:AraC family transcriptional regulator ligand-binding domain-containing protein n=1 Tax=Nocardia vinacea TaxID=96468 RepID=UPI0007C448BC|nr:AraC family transcriptional regulator ligand-binding domain-containing protein [Nocardia vinacea]
MDAEDLVLVPRIALDNAGLTEAVRHRLARAADIPDWMLSNSRAAVPSDRSLRVWELVEHELNDPHVALRVGRTHDPRGLGLTGYLFMTAPTVAEGFARQGAYLNTLTTYFTFALAEETEEELTFDIGSLRGEGRGRDLTIQVGLVGLAARAARATGTAVDPVRVRLRQTAPRRHDRFIEAFGTSRVDFGAPTDQITFRTADLALPLATSDPVLADILLRYAEIVPAMPAPATTWSDQLHYLLLKMLGDGPVTLDRAARRMATSRRSLQRRLEEEGTTWRRELDRARHAQLEDPSSRLSLNQAGMARRLGYSDARAFRRAQRRWAAEDDGTIKDDSFKGR